MDIRPNQLVALAFVIGTVLILLYEVWALNWRDPQWTITYVLRDWSEKNPIIPLTIGVLIGHLFFCQHVVIYRNDPVSVPIERKVEIVQKVIGDIPPD